ncbi:NUDIX hydrolase [Lederbergia wuyishanensis]|uniref:ADP-ribose pyrophosphatase YjhB (NUDIX family) n=1 Tax=Lederbergia wuyishanensis TaxID=1347903 RepID=A0ABU0D0H2_9BACI|nr:NUDIX domain-containing protein [Lederbergia wuyishanensis]MCJ8006523.1 NUDIX domain-containing protein [Lederbergia wuyishanensis]MDQ0341900.1 ADP-ribose pyrophosphatase YjhB (NUDIX family) [Lederbergia wuyishanensis]
MILDAVFKTETAIFNYRVAGIWIENGHVLLHRAVNEENWSLPGGRVALLEESRESIRREFLEELGVDIHIDRLVWIGENFFEYRGKEFHEIGFYYMITSNHSLYCIEPFYGLEGDGLIYKWTPISEIINMELYPRYLRTGLNNLPITTEHFVEKQ